MRSICAVCAIWWICFSNQAADLTLWYQQPAGGNHMMDEALPIGNGSSGALISGGVPREEIVLNEDSLWSGDANTSGDYGTMGTYQALGSLVMEFQNQSDPSNYRRELNLGEALAHVEYVCAGTKYTREYFASHADGVLVIHLTADKPGMYSGTISLADSR